MMVTHRALFAVATLSAAATGLVVALGAMSASCSQAPHADVAEPVSVVQQPLIGSGPVVQNPDASQTITQPIGTTFAANRFDQVRYADQFPGSDVGAQIAAAIADLPNPSGASQGGGIVDATGLGGGSAYLTLSSNMFATAIPDGGTTPKPGRLILGEGNFLVSAPQYVPSNWEIVGVNGTLIGGVYAGGTTFTVDSHFPTSGPQAIFYYFDASYTKTHGIYVNCQLLAPKAATCNKTGTVDACSASGVTAFLIDSNNSPGVSTHNEFDSVYANMCSCGMEWGTQTNQFDAGTAFQRDQIGLRNFNFYDNTCAGLVVNGGNAGQGSIVEKGSISVFHNSGATSLTDQDGILLLSSPLQFSIRETSFGAGAGSLGAGIHVVNAGSSTLYVENAEFEMDPNGSNPNAADLQVDPGSQFGSYVLIGNSLGGNANQPVIKIGSEQQVTTIGNFFSQGLGLVTTAGSDIVSINDFANTGAGWQVPLDGGSKITSLGRSDAVANYGHTLLSGRLALPHPDVSGTITSVACSPSCSTKCGAGVQATAQHGFTSLYSDAGAPRVLATAQANVGGNFWVYSDYGQFIICQSTSTPVTYSYMVVDNATTP